MRTPPCWRVTGVARTAGKTRAFRGGACFISEVRSVAIALSFALLGACGGGLLSQHPEFDAARQRLPERYSACDEGSVGACTELAFELEKHSPGAELPTVLALHRIACTRGSEPSCLELALREFPREPSALGRLKTFCARDREMRACELLTREGDEDAAKVGCELRTDRGCWTLNEIWKKRLRAEPARDFFSSQCSQRNGEACLMAAAWAGSAAATAPDLSSTKPFPGEMVWYQRACDAGMPSGCQSLAAALVARAVSTGARQECQLFGSSLRRACQTPESCRAHLYCQAMAGDTAALTQLDHCRPRKGAAARQREQRDDVECALYLQLPASVRKPKHRKR